MNQNGQTALLADMQGELTANGAILHATSPMLPYEEEVDIHSYLDILSDNRWLIAKVACVVIAIGIAYAFLAKPIYEATMLIHVEEDKPNTSKNILGDIGALFDVKTQAISEIELLNSRLVIGRAVDKLNLNIHVHPKYFPLIGALIAKQQDSLSTPGVFGYGGYVWGDEKMDVSSFSIPDAFQDQEFSVTALGDNRYRLSLPKWDVELDGVVGTELDANTAQGKLSLMVKQLSANAGAQFSLTSRPKIAEIKDVQDHMAIAEKGKQSGVIGVTIESDNPNTARNILAAIGTEYIRQNVDRKLEESEKSLAFLDAKLPDLKKKLEDSEQQYYQFRNAHGTVDLPEESRLALQQNMAARTKLLDLEQKREELLVNFTPNHPIVIGVNKQIQEMNTEIATTSGKIKELPILEQELLRLNREVKINTDLYAELLNTEQQLRLAKAGKVSNVRLVDAPMTPDKSVRPNRPKIIGLSIILGLLLGFAAMFAKRMGKSGIDDPRKIEKMLGVRVVYASIPHSKTQEDLQRRMGKTEKKLPILAGVAPEDIAIESMRSFRTAFQSATTRFRNNIVLISGPTAGVGKSFVSVNFATVMASSGKRVLLIDADLRKGYLHNYFGLERRGGLSETIRGLISPQQAIYRNVQENLDFLSTGSLPPNPAEFLLHRKFGELLKLLSDDYDFVLIDPPPILAVSDTLVIGSHAGAIFILARSDVTTESEINESIKRLNQAGVSPTGILFNDLKIRPRSYGQYYYQENEALEYAH